jgi:DNA-binding transcriptional MerR regulator
MINHDRMTITEIAQKVGVSPKTIMRWEKAGKIQKPKRDWKGWRFYLEEDLQDFQRITGSVQVF